MTFGALATVALCYDTLPEQLPVTRWSHAPKTWLLALRVPFINLGTLAGATLLARALRRHDASAATERAISALCLTTALKAATEAAELLALPTTSALTPALLLLVVLAGLGFAGHQLHPTLSSGRWREVRWTTGEHVVGGLVALCVVAMSALSVVR